MSAASPLSHQIPTGVPGLDTILNGGLLRGAAYIVQGPPGAGKTILSNQICFNHAGRGEVALYVSLLAESHDRMLQFMRRMDFFSAESVPERLMYLSAYDTLQREGLPGVLKLLSKETRARAATLVVFDGLFVVHDAASDEKDFRKFVHELQGTASMTGATMLLLTNQRREPSSPEFTMVDGWIELHDEAQKLQAWRSLTVHKQRGGGFVRGQNYFGITDAGIQVFPRLEAVFAETVPTDETEERVTSGSPPFDTMLHGGYPALSATLLYGPTGVGKTTLGLHFIGQSTPEAPGLIFGFYETPKRLQTKAASIGVDLAGLARQGAVEVFWRSPAENIVDEICYDILAAVERTKAKRVFVDGLAVFKNLLRFSDRLSLIVNALNHRLCTLGVTVVYTLENRELFLPSDLLMDDLSSIVDNVVLLHYAQQDGLLRRNISILKVRDSDFDPISEEFHITATGIVFGEQEPQQRPEGALADPTTGGRMQPGGMRRTGKQAE